MNWRAFSFTLSLSLGLVSCSWFGGKTPEVVKEVAAPSNLKTTTPTPVASPKKDRTLEIFAKTFEQADAIHREAWWVLANERRPNGKSPFGKVQRAILSSEDAKLPNKSAFRCDRYILKRDILAAGGYPQRLEVFEKCEERLPAKKIAQVQVASLTDFEVVFYPENLEEILGLGPAILNRSIRCTLKSNVQEQLERLQCTDWAQNRTQEQMIRLDEYEYVRSGKNLIKLRGKVFENLSDTRKIEADVPLEGKILVTETELYPPEATPTPRPSVTPTPKKAVVPPTAPETEPAHDGTAGAPAEELTPLMGEDGMILPPPPRGPPAVDPDVLMMQEQQNQQQEMHDMEPPPEGAHIENGEMVMPGMEVPPEDRAGGVYGR